jgi:hypothetical protein
MRNVAMLTVGGVASLLLLKLLASLLPAALGLLFGLVALAAKLALVAVVVLFVLVLLRRRTRGRTT